MPGMKERKQQPKQDRVHAPTVTAMNVGTVTNNNPCHRQVAVQKYQLEGNSSCMMHNQTALS